MATIVREKKTGDHYILLGAGFGVFKSEKPNAFFGNWMPEKSEGQFPMVCLCGVDGKIGWALSEDVVVISIDGQTPTETFGL